MTSAKALRVAPISSADARAVIRRYHYSGKVVNNSQLHFGVFLGDKIHGALQFGPPMVKREKIGLVAGTQWNAFLELNRMAFGDALPRNSESRAIAVSMRLIRAHYPHIKWVVSFADGAQCGDGTIYRASGFRLIGIKRNDQIWTAPDGQTFSGVALTENTSEKQKEMARTICRVTATKGKHAMATGAASMKEYAAAGFTPLAGFQLKYIYFLDRSCESRLTVPVLPFSAIDEAGAGMYKGEPKRSKQAMAGTTGTAAVTTPTRALQI